MRRERSGPIFEKKSLNAFAMVLLSVTSMSTNKSLEGTVPPNGLSETKERIPFQIFLISELLFSKKL